MKDFLLDFCVHASTRSLAHVWEAAAIQGARLARVRELVRWIDNTDDAVEKRMREALAAALCAGRDSLLREALDTEPHLVCEPSGEQKGVWLMALCNALKIYGPCAYDPAALASEDGQAALACAAVRAGCDAVLREVLRAYPRKTVAHSVGEKCVAAAVECGNVAALQTLAEHGVPLGACDAAGVLPLCHALALQAPNARVVEVLLQYSDLRAMNTPQMALQRQRMLTNAYKLSVLLLHTMLVHGTDPRATSDTSENTIVHAALRARDADTVRHAIVAGALDVGAPVLASLAQAAMRARMQDMPELDFVKRLLPAMTYHQLVLQACYLAKLPFTSQIAAAHVAAASFAAYAPACGAREIYSGLRNCPFTRELAARMPLHIDVCHVEFGAASSAVCFADLLPADTYIDKVVAVYSGKLDWHASDALSKVLTGPRGRRVRLLRMAASEATVSSIIFFANHVAPWVEQLKLSIGFIRSELPDSIVDQFTNSDISLLSLSYGGFGHVPVRSNSGKMPLHKYLAAPAWNLVSNAVWTYEMHEFYPPVFCASVRVLYALARTRRADSHAAREALRSLPDELLVEVVRALACVTYARLSAADL